MDSVCKIYQNAHLGNADAQMFLIQKFHPLLNKYSLLLGYEDAYQDLQLSLLELISRKSIDDFKLQNDSVIVNYIEQSILHE